MTDSLTRDSVAIYVASQAVKGHLTATKYGPAAVACSTHPTGSSFLRSSGVGRFVVTWPDRLCTHNQAHNPKMRILFP